MFYENGWISTKTLDMLLAVWINFFYKTCTTLEQQILNPRVLSVANSRSNNKNSKNGKNRLQTNTRPSGPTPKIPPPGQKLGRKSPRVGVDFRCKSPGWAGEMVMAKNYSCIICNVSELRTWVAEVHKSQFNKSWHMKNSVETKMKIICPGSCAILSINV